MSDTKWSGPTNVRHATQADEANLFDLLMDLYRDNGFGVPPRAADLRAAIRACTREAKTTGTFIGVIDGPDGTLDGSVCVFPASWWFNRDAWYLSELWLFVKPTARAGMALYDDLFRYMLACQKATEGLDGGKWPLVTSVTSMKRLPAKMRLWSRYARLVGGIYLVDGESTATAAAASQAA